MSSARKVAANRRNAQKSTGPRTLSGKAIASMNAVKHGLAARTPVVPGESPADFQAYATRWLDDLRPAGPMQEFLAERVISVTWRLRRVGKLEAALFEPDGGREGGSLSKLIRYETALERSFYRNLKELRRLQEEELATDDTDCTDEQNEPTDEQVPADLLVTAPQDRSPDVHPPGRTT